MVLCTWIQNTETWKEGSEKSKFESDIIFKHICHFFFSESMRELWDPTKAVQKNLSDFGLAFDANAVIKAKSTKAIMVERAKKSDGNPWKKIEEEKEEKQVCFEVKNLHLEFYFFRQIYLYLPYFNLMTLKVKHHSFVIFSCEVN